MLSAALQPTSRRAVTILRERSTWTMWSFAPWNAQTGTPRAVRTAFSSPLPQIGTAAAKRSGQRLSRSQTPKPPIDNPNEVEALRINGVAAKEYVQELHRERTWPAGSRGGSVAGHHILLSTQVTRGLALMTVPAFGTSAECREFVDQVRRRRCRRSRGVARPIAARLEQIGEVRRLDSRK